MLMQEVFEHVELEIRECLAVAWAQGDHGRDWVDDVGARQVVDRAVVDDVLCRDVSKREVVAILAFRPA